MLAGAEIGERHGKGERFVVIGGDAQERSADGAVFVDEGDRRRLRLRRRF